MDHENNGGFVLPSPPPIPEGNLPTKIPGNHDPAIPHILVPNITTRKGYGKEGRHVDLIVNHFRAELVDTSSVYHYDVLIEPHVKNKTIKRDVMTKLWNMYEVVEFEHRQFIYDGDKKLLTHGCLPFSSKDFSVYLDDSNKRSRGDHFDKNGGNNKRRRGVGNKGEFTIRITFASKIRMGAIYEMMKNRSGAQEALAVLDTMLRESAMRQNFLLVRNNFYHPSLGPIVHLGEGVVGWRGYHSSFKPTSAGLTLNLNITMTTVFDATSIVEFLKEKFNLQSVSDMENRNWAKASRVLKNIMVQSTHSVVVRVYRFVGFSERPMQELRFNKKVYDSNGQKWEEDTSVMKYFLDTYSYKVRYPYLPAVNVGTKKGPIYLPLETCMVVEGQRYMGTLSGKMRQLQIAACNQGPQERQRICESAIHVNGFASNKLFKEFGVRFDNKLSRIEGRVLSTPKLEFGGGRIEQPREGRWNFANKKLNQGAEIGDWAVAIFDPRCNNGDFIAHQLMFACCKLGMKMEKPLQVVKEHHNVSHHPCEDRVLQMFSEIKSLCSQRRPTFILAILPEKDSALYVAFKKFCEIKLGVISQCLVRPRMMNDQYFGNLALKINLKFGGCNSPLRFGTVKIFDVPTIIFGMDVSHGSPGDVNAPSIAAIVATKNWPEVFHYSTQVRAQPAKTEMIQDLQCMVKHCLLEFYRSCPDFYTNDMRKPSQLIVYRDGLNDGKFLECLEIEFLAFKRAIRELGEDYNPGITFIVAKKRHNTRFFPGGQERLKNGNVLPGTVVDKVVCDPIGYDFFLVSQAAFIGTSHPTHYHVLVNENNLGPDNLQSLTFDLCHTYGPCTTSISIVAPVAYAHALAARYMKYVNSLDRRYDTGALRSSRDGGTTMSTQVATLPTISLSPKHSMFFV